MVVTDVDEWLRPGVDHDDVTLDVDEVSVGLVLRAVLAVTPALRTVDLVVTLGGARARHDAEEPGPPSSNWDRMRIGLVEWRMVEVLRHWELTVDDPAAGLRAYLGFVATAPCVPLPDGYEQVGAVRGQVQLAERRVTLTGAPARRTHTWH